MGPIISFILGLIILGILYKNMIAWEGDYRISRGQALLPVLLGLFMMLGLAMGRHLGLARYNKVTGRGSVVKEYLLAYFAPVFCHTVFDFFAANMLIHAGDNVETITEEIQRTTYIGAGMVLIIVVPIFFFQFYIFRRLKKNAANLVALSFIAENSTEQESTNA